MGEADDGISGEKIALPFERLSRLMRAAEHDGGLNPAQWEALRYLARANRFSNSPGALTRYLGATKGTISQTVIALERKGYIVKSARSGEKRSVELKLTANGEDVLKKDPWATLAAAAEELGGKTKRRLAKGLRELLDGELKRGKHPSFGQCASCRYFREKGEGNGHYCMLLETSLTVDDSRRICVEHEAA